jgi:phage N-6-adenine-methyltransferase
MINKGLYTSSSAEWSTPQDFFDKINVEFGPFDLDPCATSKNAKAPKFFTKEQNGLRKKWRGKVWMNPPYGREITAWMKKAYIASLTTADIVVCLVPARTDTKWWHDYAMKGKLRFVRGRLKFSGSKMSAPFPSAIVIFKSPKTKKGKIIKCKKCKH